MDSKAVEGFLTNSIYYQDRDCILQWINVKRGIRIPKRCGSIFKATLYYRPFFLNGRFIVLQRHTLIDSEAEDDQIKPFYSRTACWCWVSHYKCLSTEASPFCKDTYWSQLKPFRNQEVYLLLWGLKNAKPQLNAELNYMILVHFFLEIN